LISLVCFGVINWQKNGGRKIENVAFSCFSALIFLPTYLTNDRNSSNRELLFLSLVYGAKPGD
jgi:hypothetical protein